MAQVGVFSGQDLVEIPDFESVAHTDDQRAVRFAVARIEPGCDGDLALAVEPRGRGEAKIAAQVDKMFDLCSPTFGNAATLKALHALLDHRLVVNDEMFSRFVQRNEQTVIRFS